MDATVNGEGEEEGNQKRIKNKSKLKNKLIQFGFVEGYQRKSNDKYIYIEHKEEKRDKKKNRRVWYKYN